MPLDVLIVDDSTAIRKILQRVLRQAEAPFLAAGERSEIQICLAPARNEHAPRPVPANPQSISA